MVEVRKLKKYQVNYHRRGEGINKFNLLWKVVEAVNAQSAMRIAKKEISNKWVIENAVRRYGK